LDNQDIIRKCEDLLRQYNILNQIAKTVASTLDLNKLLRIILTGVTLGDGFGFNRAFLFLIDREKKKLAGRMAIGPGSEEEAWRIWGEIQYKSYSLEEFLSSEKIEYEQHNTALDDNIRKINITLDPEKVCSKCLEDGIPRNVDLTVTESQELHEGSCQSIHDQSISYFITVKNLIDEELLEYVNYPKFCVLPLISRTKKVGILVVDNKYNRREITDDDIKFLLMLSQFAASSIRNTIIYNDLKDSLSALAKLNLKLNYLKEYNENIIESIPVSILVFDKSMTATVCNENASKIMKRDKSQIIGKKIDVHKIYIDGINLQDEINRVIGENKAEGFYRVKISINDKSLNNIYDIFLAPFKFSESVSEGVIIIIEDITRTVELENAVRESKRLSQLGKLSATVAHEIRNPLVAIGGYAKRLKRKFMDYGEVDSKSIDTIVEEVERLETIVHDILDFASERKMEFVEINLSSLLEKCIEFAKVAAEQNNIEIILNSGSEILESKNMLIKGSFNNLKQAFINVLNNAIEASSTKDIITIDILTEADELNYWIVIKINNRSELKVGSDIYNIFLPFFTTKTKGTGLGLTITRKIIEQHSGQINVESNAENGTTFTIKLPLLKFQF